MFITHDTTVCHGQNTFQLESSTSTKLQHLASQSAQPLPRVCNAPRVATDRAALKTSNACSHCAAATQAVMTVPKDTRFNCRVAKRAVSWKEIGSMVWQNIGSVTCKFDARNLHTETSTHVRRCKAPVICDRLCLTVGPKLFASEQHGKRTGT